MLKKIGGYLFRLFQGLIVIVLIPTIASFFGPSSALSFANLQQSWSWLFNRDYYETFESGRSEFNALLRERRRLFGTNADVELKTALFKMESAAENGVWGANYFLALIYAEGVPNLLEADSSLCRYYMQRSFDNWYAASDFDRC